ncbi:MAG TPA: hypothetical protein VF085_00610 [Solirubrobacterales bacterium]
MARFLGAASDLRVDLRLPASPFLLDLNLLGALRLFDLLLRSLLVDSGWRLVAVRGEGERHLRLLVVTRGPID